MTFNKGQQNNGCLNLFVKTRKSL